MSTMDIMTTKYADMLDMIACHAIYNGSARQKQKKKDYGIMEALMLR